MNRLLELRSKDKRPPLSSCITNSNPIFADMKICMKKRDRIVPLTYNNRSGNIESGKDIYSISYIKAPLCWFFDEPIELEFKCIRSQGDITPMGKMCHYSSTCIYH